MKPTLLKFMTNILVIVLIGHSISQFFLYSYLQQSLSTEDVYRILLLNSFFTLLAWTVFTPLYYHLVHGRLFRQTPNKEILS